MKFKPAMSFRNWNKISLYEWKKKLLWNDYFLRVFGWTYHEC